jgi:hypothetical protein
MVVGFTAGLSGNLKGGVISFERLSFTKIKEQESIYSHDVIRRRRTELKSVYSPEKKAADFGTGCICDKPTLLSTNN